MEIRDLLHGAIQVNKAELPLINSAFFQRLRHIKQLGFSENSFPSASHNRYIHSLGAMEVASQAFDHIFSTKHREIGAENDRSETWLRLSETRPEAFIRLRAITRLAALLHDVGHGPLSHTTEIAMKNVSLLKIPGDLSPAKDRQATHEDYTLKILLDSPMTPLLQKAGTNLGFSPRHIAALIDPSIEVQDDFFEENIGGENINFRPILQQLISSELDADRMDYLRRDSLCSGVTYGEFDYDWLVSNLTAHVSKGNCYLAFEHRAIYAFEDFLISRFHMFLMVYFHYKSVIFDEMLTQYFRSPDCTYRLPTDIEKYLHCHDAHLYAHLLESKNDWARRISDRRPYQMLMELHSGIPATPSANRDQQSLLEKTEADLRKKKIPFILSRSTGELSKYFHNPGEPIFVRYDNGFSKPSFIPLEKCHRPL